MEDRRIKKTKKDFETTALLLTNNLMVFMQAMKAYKK